YQASDAIGVMSKKSVEYFIKHNPEIEREKVSVLENSIIPDSEVDIQELINHRIAIRSKFHIPLDAVVFIYGGVIGLSQGVDFILKSVAKASSVTGAYFLFVGKGKGYEKLKIWSITNRCSNVMILDFMEQQEYKKLAASCDVGLVYLDYRFSYPNIPSRSLGHMNIGQPILAATDEYTDYKELIESNKLGLWCSSKDVNQFHKNVEILVNNSSFRKNCGINGRHYLQENCDARKTCEAICEKMRGTYGRR
ncbi:MAG: glycosyltransferase WbuB, partial [Spirochaetae bacterium HGW-Spirochaetae-8]